MRCRTKNKIANARRERQQTGGGAPSYELLSKTEENIASIINEVLISGHNTTKKSRATFNSSLPTVNPASSSCCK